MTHEPDPETFLPEDLGDLLFEAPRASLPELRRRVLALGVERIPLEDDRFRAVWAAIDAGGLPSVAEARALRELAQELAAAFAAAPDDFAAWQRVELAEALVGALDTSPSAAAYEATYGVHRAVDDHDAVLGVVRAVTGAQPAD